MGPVELVVFLPELASGAPHADSPSVKASTVVIVVFKKIGFFFNVFLLEYISNNSIRFIARLTTSFHRAYVSPKYPKSWYIPYF